MSQPTRISPSAESALAPGRGPHPSVIRARAFVLGALIIPANNFWIIMTEKVERGPYPTIISLFADVVFILAVLAIVNSILRRINHRLAFSTAEMLVVYTMVSMGASLAGHDMLPNLVMAMTYPYRFATPANDWDSMFIPNLPRTLTVSDPAALKSFYEGNSTFYRAEHLYAWLGPLMRWTVFVIALVFVMMCINTIVRRQWIDRERLTFPIVQLPMAMTEPRGALWRNKLFWIAFAIAFAIDLVNGLAAYYPNIPVLNVGHVGHDLGANVTSRPWNAIGWTPYTFHPFVIGLGYLLPADLSFSCWFFYIFWKLQMVAASAIGVENVPDFPYIRHQAFGGYVAIILVLAWTGRGYLRQVWRRICARPSELDDSEEPISYRTAAAGAVLGFLFLCWFMVTVRMSPWVAVLAFVIYFVLATAIARMRAELGPPVHDLHFSGPDYMITSSIGLGRLDKGDLVGLSYLYWFNRAYRGHPMPIGIEGMKMAQATGSSQKRFFWAVMLAVAIGSLATFWAFLHLGYKLGLTAKFAWGAYSAHESFRNLESWLQPTGQTLAPNWGADVAMVGGFFFCALLGSLRLRFFNFPFHPIGYAISGSWSMNLVWAPIMIAWLAKVVILHWGGLKLYRAALPFFFGLILGQMTVGCLWSLIGIGFGIPYYSFWGA